MKVWASATAIGFSMAYLACSSSPPSDGNTYVPPAGGGATGTAGSAPTAGANPGTSGATQAGGGADVGGAAPAGGGAPPAGGGAPPVAGAAGAAGANTAGAGGATAGGETEVPCPANVAGHCSSGVTYPTYDGYTLSLVEDFPVAVDLNNDPVFTWSDGIPNQSQAAFAEANITFANGRMILTAQSKCPPGNSVACYPPRVSYAESHKGEVPLAAADRPAAGVISGEFRTKYNNYRYGRYEAKYTTPATTIGNFLSTMFVFRNPADVAWNEVDNELEPNQQGKLNVNTINKPDGALGYPGGAFVDAVSIPVAGLNIAQEHTYAFDWTPTGITWYVDNKPTPVYTHAANASPPIPALSAKIMMNLWVFQDSTNFGDPSKNVYPMTSSYDYFHFYKLNTETTYPCSPTPGCLSKTNGDYTDAAQNNPKETPYLK